MSELTVVAKGTEKQIAAALRDLADRVEIWGKDHAPMGHKGNDKIGEYHASYNDWEYAD